MLVPKPRPTEHHTSLEEMQRVQRHVGSIFDFTYADVAIEDYDPHPAIRAPVAV